MATIAQYSIRRFWTAQMWHLNILLQVRLFAWQAKYPVIYFFRVPHSTSDEMNEAVASAKAAFKTWSKTTPLARQQILFKSVDVLTAHLLLPLSLPEPGVKLFFFRCIASPYKLNRTSFNNIFLTTFFAHFSSATIELVYFIKVSGVDQGKPQGRG